MFRLFRHAAAGLPLRPLPLLVAVAAMLLGAGTVQPARAAEALFPALPPATQVTREFSLQQAAQAGMVKLQAKGGSEGDAVSLELQGKKAKGPITVTVRAEFSVKPSKGEYERNSIRDALQGIRERTEADMNRLPYKTKSGDSIRFVLDLRYREPEQAATGNYHQVTVIDELKDLPEPDPDFRSGFDDVGVPNSTGSVNGEFSVRQLQPKIMSHEFLHLAGLDDRYHDYYRVRGKDYPLPGRGMSPGDLKKFLAGHRPPLPPPPAGKVIVKDDPKTPRCDIMSTQSDAPCRKISKRDLDWFDSQAGVLVRAEPGETLLNKNPSNQNFGIGFKTLVFATPGSTTVANGIAVYCLDHDRTFPLSDGFDVGPSASQLPGYEGVAKLLALNGQQQAGLDEPIVGMQAAIWNLTDASPLATSGTAEESRALMTQAGVVEDSVPGGLPPLEDPNAGAADTGAVDASGAVMATTAAEAVQPPPAVRLDSAALFPNRLRAGRRARADLLVAATGMVERLTVSLQRRAKRRWGRAQLLATRELEAGSAVVPLSFGSLRAGSYRLLVAVSGPLGDPVVQRVPFAVRP